MKKLIFSLILLMVSTTATAQLWYYKQPGSHIHSYIDRAENPGAIMYVNSAESASSDGTGYGQEPDAPYATIDYAMSQCTASEGDIIYVGPGHVEDLGSAETIDIDCAGVTIIGTGAGELRPRVDYNYTTSSVDIGADDVTIRNLTFRPGVTSTAIGIDVEAGADNFTMEFCEFLVGEASGTDEFVVTVDVKIGSDDTVIRDNIFRTAITDASCTSAINLGAGGAVARTQIVDNFFYGNWSTAAIIDGTTACTEILIMGNVIKVKDGEPGIELHNNTTAMIAYNAIESTSLGDPDNAIVAADSSFIDNCAATSDGGICSPVGGTDVATIGAELTLIGSTVDDIETTLNLVGATTDDIETALTLVGNTADTIASALTLVGATTDDIETALTLVGDTCDDMEAALALAGTTLDDIETKVDSALTAIGTVFAISKSLAGSAVVAGGAALTGASSGTLELIDVVILNGTTAFDSSGDGAVFEMYSNNTQGSATFLATTEASLGSLISLDLRNATTTDNRLVLEAGKVISVKATTEDFTSDNVFTVWLVFRRLTAAATVAAS